MLMNRQNREASEINKAAIKSWWKQSQMNQVSACQQVTRLCWPTLGGIYSREEPPRCLLHNTYVMHMAGVSDFPRSPAMPRRPRRHAAAPENTCERRKHLHQHFNTCAASAQRETPKVAQMTADMHVSRVSEKQMNALDLLKSFILKNSFHFL